jgi:hypothetical protein
MPPRTWLLTALTVASLACREPEPPGSASPPAPAAKATPEPPSVKAAPPAAIRTVAIPPNVSPDPGYGVHIGDRAVLWRLYREGKVALVAEDWLTCKELEKFVNADDRDGILDLVGAGRVAQVPLGAEALVLDVRGDPDHPRDTDPVQVRVFRTDGESLQVWTPRVCVVRLTPD